MFIGREAELEQLRELFDYGIASLVVIKGRRRVGKSRLIDEFARQYKYYKFMGLAPRAGISAADQRREFVRQLKYQLGLVAVSDSDWGELFLLLAKNTSKGKIVILFDEITWMAIGDPDFLGKLKNVWDMHFAKNTQLVLILCGSVSAWIEKNILGNTGYLGRPNLHITLHQLPLNQCNLFWKQQTSRISAYEKLKVLAVTGGVPRYLELIRTSLSAEDNIRKLCFQPNSPLFDEFKYIFSDIYGKRSKVYQDIVTKLLNSKLTRDEIIEQLGRRRGGDISEYLDELEIGGFITRDFTWSISTKKISKLSYYRLKDNYTRFYLKYILPNKNRIESLQLKNISISELPAWNTMLGLQFENLVLNNINNLIKIIGIRIEDVLLANPYFQRPTTRQRGCQIDLMIQTRHDVIYVCEIKFSKEILGKNIISEVQNKIDKIKLPKQVSVRTVLIHVNGVCEAVIDEQYFANIIDFSQFLI